MKKILSISLCLFALAIFSTSCDSGSDDDDTVVFDENMLIGTWKYEKDSKTTEYERFFSEKGDSPYENYKKGEAWVEPEVTEQDAQPFVWSITKSDNDNFAQIHLSENGTASPVTYTLTKLTSTEMSYKDGSKVKNFTKVVK
ncbi:MAG: hypothetical protein N4A49_12360 [Marinifilaceae bacterium]|jgi:hypothetical protein|nr:hypothetical protein [Marinifilaceae bacterium]